MKSHLMIMAPYLNLKIRCSSVKKTVLSWNIKAGYKRKLSSIFPLSRAINAL